MLKIEKMTEQRFRIRSKFGIVARILGLAFVGFGCWIGVTPFLLNCLYWILGRISTGAMIACVPGMLIGIVIGVPMLCVGFAMAFLGHRVEIDLAEKRVTDVNDFLIWKSRKSYSIAEVKKVLLNTTILRGKDMTRYYVNALIVTNVDSVTVVSEPATREEEVREVARQLAEILGVTLEDEISDE